MQDLLKIFTGLKAVGLQLTGSGTHMELPGWQHWDSHGASGTAAAGLKPGMHFCYVWDAEGSCKPGPGFQGGQIWLLGTNMGVSLRGQSSTGVELLK